MYHTIGMKKYTDHENAIFKLLRKQGTLRSCDLKALGIPRMVIVRLIGKGELERVARGLYRKPNTFLSEKETMVNIAIKVPKAVFCLLSALQFHELTTQLPREVWIAMPRGSHTPKMDYPSIRMIQYSKAAYSAGIEDHKVDQTLLRVYSPAKTVVDCFKFRNKIGLDVALEALNDVLKKKKATMDEIYRFAKLERVHKVMQPYLEAMMI